MEKEAEPGALICTIMACPGYSKPPRDGSQRYKYYVGICVEESVGIMLDAGLELVTSKRAKFIQVLVNGRAFWIKRIYARVMT
jgi:hypothetical protein